MSKKQLKIIFLGGIEEIGKNMTAIEYGDNILLIDAGMTFPSEAMLGVDVIIPDMTYLVENKDKIRGVLLTHGHEDHIGAIPFLIRSLPNTPLTFYGSKLTLAFIEHKCRENKLDMPKMVCVSGGQVENILCFKIEFIKVCHSISGAFALSIETPLGIIFHTGDYKIDYTPVDNQVTDLARIAEIGKKGVLLMLGESTNIEMPGHTMSEKTVGESFDLIFSENMDRRIIVATFASNVHRVQQLLDSAEKYKRRVCIAGRSMINISEMAMEIGELKCNRNIFVQQDKVNKVPPEKLLIIATGTQGEPSSALTRMARGDFNKIALGDKDTVVLSSSAIPGNERLVYSVINNLYGIGANVIYDDLRDVHVSGHACLEEMKLMLSLVNPKYFIPVHGEMRHLKLHAKLAEKLGVKEANIIIPKIGGVYEVKKNGIAKVGSVTAGNLFVDGLTVDDMSSIVLNDRRQLAGDGFLIVLVKISADSGMLNAPAEIIYRGISSLDNYIEEFKKSIQELINNGNYKGKANTNALQSDIKKLMRKLIINKIKQYPMILPIIIEY